MLRYIRLAAIVMIATVLGISTSVAETCAQRSDFIALLKDRFGEIEVAQGLSSNGHLVEIFVAPAGNWTILLSRPNGLSCLVDAGEPWLMAPAADQTGGATQHPTSTLPGQRGD
ncbi:hypothetical protein [uncultured Bradyrhizobium sp.]|uniref:hypothetical protein n=1 Tax=Bradyrhizobium sp. TaxID=376 RepID=UPI0026272CB8|nr:hypothetical protein [uncultured Bradyrhizobium sp.]